MDSTQVFNNHLILAKLMQFLRVRDLLNLRQVNSLCDYVARRQLYRMGTSGQVLRDDEQIYKFTEVVKGYDGLCHPFSSFTLHLATISMDGITRFLKHQEHILELSIEIYSSQYAADWVRQVYVTEMVGQKLARILIACSRTLRTLRLKFFGDVTLVNDEESSIFPLQLVALRTLEVTYYNPNRELDNDLMAHLTNRAEFLEHIDVRYFHKGDFDGNLIPRLKHLLFGRKRTIVPSLSLSTNTILTEDAGNLAELYKMGYSRLRKLNLGLISHSRLHELIPDRCLEALRILSSLLQLQSETLEDLLIETFEVGSSQQTNLNVQIKLPPLKKLKRLALYFHPKGNNLISPVAPFDTGQFPNLSEVDLFSPQIN